MILVQQQRPNSLGNYYFYVYDDHVLGTMHGRMIKELSDEDPIVTEQRLRSLGPLWNRILVSGLPICSFDEGSDISSPVRVDEGGGENE